MASIVFATVGQAAGGPLGAAVGAAVGGTVDGALFGRGSARAGDLLLQRSTYGEAIPRLYGATRQAGILIWALPLTKSGGEKGGDRKAYTSSFAIALSSRPIDRVGRIWADGREIRNAAGEFETTTKFRTHNGSGNGVADSAIAAAEGLNGSPAYGNIAYVVFEDMPLSGYGNRIPNLSFEVFADQPDVSPGDWLGDLAGVSTVKAYPADAARNLSGFAAGQERWADDVVTLARAADISESYTDGYLAFRAAGVVHVVPETDLCINGGDLEGWASRREQALADRPAGVIIRYFDPERDYLSGSQRAFRDGVGRQLRVDAPLTAGAAGARGLADRLLRQAEASADMLEIALGWRWLGVAVGERLQIAGKAEVWRVVRRDIEGLIIRLFCEASPFSTSGSFQPSAPGRVLPAPVVVSEPTVLDIFELPLAFDDRVGGGLLVAASGGPGWRGAEIDWSFSSGDWHFVGAASRPAIAGVLARPLETGSGQLWDEKAVLEVQLDRDEMWLESRSASAILAGANLLWVAGELVQFRSALAMGSGSFRLTGLLRRRLGTVASAEALPAGARVVKVERDQVRFVHVPADHVGEKILVRSLGRGDPAGGTLVEVEFGGAGAAPLGPCHLRVSRQNDGQLDVTWVPRDRNFFDWSANDSDTSRTFTCQFTIVDDGQVKSINKNVSGFAFSYSREEQILDFGSELFEFDLVIFAEGDGAANVRASDVYHF